jgi:hypothetical protein
LLEILNVSHIHSVLSKLIRPADAKWFTLTPALEEKKRKEKARKDKRKASRLTLNTTTDPKTTTSSTTNDISSDDTSDNEDQLAEKENEPPTKKLKTRPKITAYIEIVTAPRTLKEKPTPLSRGPFFFNLDTTRIDFLQSLASCCVEGHYAPTITSINHHQLFWKLQVPANDRKRPLSTEDGFRALIDKLADLSQKKKDTTIILSLPPLTRVAANVSCDSFLYIHFPYILDDSQQMLWLVKEASISSGRNSRRGPWDQQSESSR